MKKKFIYTCLFLIMGFIGLSMVGIDVNAAEGNRVKTLNYGDWEGYVNSDGTFTLVGVYSSISPYLKGTLTLPNSVEGHKVTRIEGLEGHSMSYSYYDNFDIFSPELVKVLIIPDTVEYIEKDCFDNFTKVETLRLPNNKKFYDAGYAEGGFTDFKFGNDHLWAAVKDLSTRNIEVNMEAPNLKTIRLYEGEDIIQYYGYFENLENINFPASAKRIFLHDFNGIATFKEGTTFIDLSNVEGLNNWTLPNSLTQLEIGYVDSLTSLNLPFNVKYLSLQNCKNISSINTSRGLQNVNVSRAVDCPKLTIDITISENGCLDRYTNSGIKSITLDYEIIPGWGYNKDAFKGMKNLKEIKVNSSKNKHFYSIDGVLYWSEDTKLKDNDDLCAYPAAKSTTSNYTLPSWVKCVYATAFNSCKFTSIIIPENVSNEYYWDEWWDDNHNDISFLSECSAILRVVPYSNACDVYDSNSTKSLANTLNVSSNRIVFYKGNTYTITYNLNGGKNSSKNPIKYTAGDKPITLTNPTRKGYTFVGWKRNDVSDFENTTEINNKFQNYTFTAVWAKNISKAKVKKVVNLKGAKAKVTWKKVKSSNGYEVQYATNKKFNSKGRVKTVTVKSSKKTVIVKRLTKKKTYYFRIRAYKTVQKKNVYGAWSKTQKVKIKK